MSPQLLIELFFALCASGAVAAIFFSDRSIVSLLGWLGSMASVAMLGLGVLGIAGSNFSVRLWTVPQLGVFTLSIDPLSALFLFVSGLVFLPASIYSVGYLRHYLGFFSMRSLCACYFGLLSSVVLVLCAADAISFLVSWELMSIFAYFLVNFQRRGEEDPRPGYMMLTMGEAGFMAVVMAFVILAAFSNDLSFVGLRLEASSLGSGTRWAVFLLSFFGFGVKAGLVPFNRWLSKAHPVAPANVSAFLSGALLNLGIYGIARFNLDLAPVTTDGPGLIVLVIGTISALVGILYANRENDMKTMLAESSIENMGIVTAGVGAGIVFYSLHVPGLAGIAFIAALYHMTNHSVYKSLLFFGAGSIDSTLGTRDMDRLGGLIKSLPWTAAFFLVGALSIASLPPFNGFVSEWLTLQALLQSAALQSAGVKVIFALCGAVLALTAALAVTCFVKVYAMSFLGISRSNGIQQSGRVHRSMRVAMGFLAALCLILGVLPTYIISALDQPVSRLVQTRTADALVPPFFITSTERGPLPPAFVSEFHDLGAQVGRRVLPGPGLVVLHRGGPKNPVVFAMSTTYALVVLVLLLGSVFLLVRWWVARGTSCVRKPVWAGGLRPLLPELTYTATGFSNPVRVTFNAIFHPTEAEDSSEMVAQHFRMAIRRLVEEVHVLDRLFYRPIHLGATKVAAGLARMHHGRLNAYVAYVLLALLAVLLLGRVL